MSPLSTRIDNAMNTSNRTTGISTGTGHSMQLSPMKHLRQAPASIRMSFGTSTDDDDEDNDNGSNMSMTMIHDIDEEDSTGSVHHPNQSRTSMNGGVHHPKRYMVPSNTPMINTGKTSSIKTMTTASRLLFHEFDKEQYDTNNTSGTVVHSKTSRQSRTPSRRTIRTHHSNSHNNNELNDTTSSAESVMSTSSSSSTTFLCSNTNSPYTQPPRHELQQQQQGRKRNSVERRQKTNTDIGTMTPMKGNISHYSTLHGTNTNVYINGSTSGVPINDTTTQEPLYSPKMSPNSFVTMDGRFVQSKNPFSSPMIMTDTPIYMGATTTLPSSTQATTTTSNTAPSLPAFYSTSFDNDDNNDNHTKHRILQPKIHGTPVSDATNSLQAFTLHNNSTKKHHDVTSYLFHRSSSSCSPIPEHDQLLASLSPTNHNLPKKEQQPQLPPQQQQSISMAMMMAMECTDDIPSAGSLHKVRRIHHTDDVFAASNHHLSNIRTSMNQNTNNNPTKIDTSMNTYNDMNDDISPTDVMSYPNHTTGMFFAPTPAVPKHGPPPTPIKQKIKPSSLLWNNHNNNSNHHHHNNNGFYSSKQWDRTTTSSPPHTPGPPPVTRKLLQPRTPFASFLPSNMEEEDDNNNENYSMNATNNRYHLYENNNEEGQYNKNNHWFESTNGDTDEYTNMTTGIFNRNHYQNDNDMKMLHRIGSSLSTSTSSSSSNQNQRQQQQQNTSSRFYSDFDIIGELGHGSFGSVYKVLSRLDGCMYAIKAAKRKAKGIADRDRMLKEVYALAALSDQADTANFHIVRYHQAWMEDDRLYIQTELCSGTLIDEMNRGSLSMSRRYKLLREILLALDFIHRHNMVHLDIKPENIFIKNDQYKLGDFGLVTKASSSQDVEEGDSRYMSMELLSGDNRTDLTKSDIFSLGITMYEICLGRQLPMNGQEWQDIRAGKLSPLPNVDHDMANIIKRMLDPNPVNRPTPMSLLKHPQLLSDEEKALNAERTKVIQANIQLAAQQHQMGGLPPKRALTRASTWSGSSIKYM